MLHQLWPLSYMKKRNDASYYQPYYVNISTNASAAAMSIAWPTFHQTDDIGFLTIVTSNQTMTTPTGWNLINSPTGTGTAGTNGSVRTYVYWLRATSAAMSSVSIADSGNKQSATMLTIRGLANTGSPVDTHTMQLVTSTTSSLSSPSVTTTGPNRFITSTFGSGVQVVMLTGPTNANLIELKKITGVSGTGGAMSYGVGIKSAAGATGNTTGSWTSTSTQENVDIAWLPMANTSAATINLVGGYNIADAQDDLIAVAALTLNANNGLITDGSSNMYEQYTSNVRANSLYETRLTKTSGAATISGSSTATWLNMGTERSWSISATTPPTFTTNSQSATVTLEIRDAATATTIDSCSVVLSADSTRTI
jgi:hypothetical protein